MTDLSLLRFWHDNDDDPEETGQWLAALESLLPVDVIDLPLGKQRYGLLLNDEGGILDDLMFVNRGADLFVIVNGACKAGDLAQLQA